MPSDTESPYFVVFCTFLHLTGGFMFLCVSFAVDVRAQDRNDNTFVALRTTHLHKRIYLKYLFALYHYSMS